MATEIHLKIYADLDDEAAAGKVGNGVATFDMVGDPNLVCFMIAGVMKANPCVYALIKAALRCMEAPEGPEVFFNDKIPRW